MMHRLLRIPIFCIFLIPALMGCDADIQNEAPPAPEMHSPPVSQEPADISDTLPTPSDPPVSQEPADIPDTIPEPETPDLPDIAAPESPADAPPTPTPDTPIRPLPDTPDFPVTSPPTPLDAAGLNNLYRLNDELYRSAQPAENGLTSAKMLGIQTVLSLQLVSLDSALEATEQTGLSLIHVPMIPWNVTENELLQALEVLRDAPKPILVHCLHGADRTGLVIAMYRILFQNWSKADAIAEMTSDLFGYHEEFSNLPKLIEQIDIEDMRSKLFEHNN